MSACRGCDDIRKAAWREANKERRAAHARRYRAENPERWQETVSRYAENNVEKIRSRALVAAHKRRARQLAVASVPFTSAQLEQRIAYYGGRCWICGAAYKHIDHVKPLSRGGAHMLCNLRPTCQRCNNRKYNRWPFSPDMILGVA